MLRSLYSGISGMKVNQTKLDVIGNNIANVGTTAFKSARVRFEDMLSQNVSQALSAGVNQGGINPRQVGLGVQLAGIDTMVTQGMMQPTSRNLDAAIDGDGYFVVGIGPVPQTNTAGVTLDANNFSSITGTNGMNISYTRDGSFTLDSQGNLLTSDGYRVMGYAVSTGTAGDPNSVDYTNGVPSVNFVDANKPYSVDKNAPTLVPLVIPDSVVTDPGDPVNGVPATSLRIQSFSIGKDGQISAVLEDGSVSVLGQIAMASFKNPAGLTKLGKNLYSESANSGDATIRTGIGSAKDNSKGYGDMLQGMLEMSNVDLAEQFTDMIVSSRAFQANTKTITTGDEILQDILSLKR
ncbi:flagellar hook-basal body complex protein [Candidatus Clostridium stratigraminis]|uniref:Flagellar hook protein FlgE n=1 Tax=Candidatus Clostridium stratigraminis TaxID=3381661 RepID=A0ABW8T4X1_9CLOT